MGGRSFCRDCRLQKVRSDFADTSREVLLRWEQSFNIDKDRPFRKDEVLKNKR